MKLCPQMMCNLNLSFPRRRESSPFKIPITLLLLLSALIWSNLSAEVRSVWVLPWDITTPQAIDEVIQTALDNNQNELLVEVRYRSDALFDTSKGASLYPNPEPQSYVLKNSSFDPLAYVLEKAHAQNLNVQAWVIVFNATPVDKTLIQQNFTYQNHRDWLTTDKSGTRLNGSRQFGYFIDPGVPEAQDYLLDVLSNLAAGYPDLDGIHLDYIRYPETGLGYHPVSVARYEEYCQNQDEIGFNEWRIMQVSNFVERMHLRLKEINPAMMLSAAVFADISDANVAYAQDWPNWLKRGIIDRIYPMAYNVNFSKYKSIVAQMKLIGHDESIVMGLRAWDDNGRTLSLNGGSRYTVNDIAKRITHTRELGFAGVAMFSLAGLKIGNAWPQLKRLSFSDSVPYPAKPKLSNTYLQTQEIVMTEQETKANVRISHEAEEYIINLSIPFEGTWIWELYGERLLYNGGRHYNKGENYDWWNGIIEGGDQELQAGHYVVHLYSEDAPFKYLIPVEVKQANE